MSIIGPNQTISPAVYDVAVQEYTSLPFDFLAAHGERIARAYDMGEPVWMIGDELRVRYDHRPQVSKSALELALRVVRVG